MPLIHEFAPAKINLYLHITGRRPDGYHMLDSLVAFTGAGDRIRLEEASGFSFAVDGPQAAALQNEPPEKNLVALAARSLAELTGNRLDVKLTLIKNLPVASGIGGGSSDAAAALRALARHWGIAPDDPRLREAASRHGQDVPVCLRIENNYITAEGEAPAPDLPHADCVLVNPGKGLPTPEVYRSYRENEDAFSLEAQFGAAPRDMVALVEMLRARRNDLYEAACRLMPEIREAVAALEKSGALLARMSGSGATCFGLFADRAAARSAAAVIHAAHPGWWVAQSSLPYRAGEPEVLAVQA